MMKRSSMIVVGLTALLLAACGTTPAAQIDPQTAAFISNLAPPAGAARVYLLPTNSKGLFQDFDGRASFALFPHDSDSGAQLGATTRSSFVAFDIGPGRYDLQAKGEEALARISATLTFDAGRTYFLRPVFFRSAKELAATGATAPATGLSFEAVPEAAATAELKGLDMVMLTPGGAAFVARTRQPTAPPAPQGAVAPVQALPAAALVVPSAVPAPSPSPAASPAAVLPEPAKPEAPSFSVLERKLRELKRLHDEGLITQRDYDEKRASLLQAY